MSTKFKKEMITTCWKSTFNLAKKIGKFLKKGDIIFLSGEVGTGKTVFVKGVCASQGIDHRRVDSASFVLLKIYEGRNKIFHFDFFRLKKFEEVEDTNFFDYLEEGIIVVEWPQLINPKFLNRSYLLVKLKHISLSKRKLIFLPYGERFRKILNKIL